MARSRPTWKERFPERVTCVRCLEVRPKDDVDRLLWCEDCRARAMARATRWGRIVGAVLAAALAVWIWVVIRPDPELVLGGWLATVLAAWWIGGRVTREIAYGAQRFANRGAMEATPPRVAPETDEDEEER